MSKVILALALATILTGEVASAASTTELQAFSKKVGKIADPGVGEKGLCVCMNSSYFFYGAAGFLRQSTTIDGSVLVTVDCVIQGFDPSTGELDYQAACIPWAPLTK